MHVCMHVFLVYLISCNSCGLQYVGSTITSFRLRFNNRKSSLNRYGRGQTNVAGQHLYAHFVGESRSGLSGLSVQVIDCTDVNNPTERESFWIKKLNCYVPNRLNLKEEV